MSKWTEKIGIAVVLVTAIPALLQAQPTTQPTLPPGASSGLGPSARPVPRREILSTTIAANPPAPVVARVPAGAPPWVPASLAVTNAPGTNAGGAKIRFATPIYDFGKVKSGDPVKYTYIFTNIGNQVLELSNVQPQCGCTAAGQWTKTVELGQTGCVPIQFNTANYNGQVLKTITVACNDKTQPVALLHLKGTIWKPIEFIPPCTVLNVMPDVPNGSAIVRIVNHMEEPLNLSGPQLNNPVFKVDFKTNQPGREYQLTLSTVPPLNPGTIVGRVTLKSSATNQPILEVPFWANVQAPVMVRPAQITLPASPLQIATTPAVTIQNNSTNPITVSSPEVNLPGVKAEVRELQPGRVFTAQVTFPQGFELPQGQKGLLTLKSSHPQFPVLQVPIVQTPRPYTTPNVGKPVLRPQFGPPIIKPNPAAQLGTITPLGAASASH